MMMQKAAEMMFSIPLAKRQIGDLESAIEQGAKAQRYLSSIGPTLLKNSRSNEQTIHFFGC